MKCSACGKEFDPLADGPISEDDGTVYCGHDCHQARWSALNHLNAVSDSRWRHCPQRRVGISYQDGPEAKELLTYREARDAMRGKGLSRKKVRRLLKGSPREAEVTNG